MFYFRGNTTNSVTSSPKDLPIKIDSFRIVNKTTGTVGVNVYVINGVTQISIMPNNLQLATQQMYEGTQEIIMLATEQIRIQTSGSIDYDFTLNNITL